MRVEGLKREVREEAAGERRRAYEPKAKVGYVSVGDQLVIYFDGVSAGKRGRSTGLIYRGGELVSGQE